MLLVVRKRDVLDSVPFLQPEAHFSQPAPYATSRGYRLESCCPEATGEQYR